MPPIKLQFFGKGVDNQITGYILLRFAKDDNLWRLGSWKKSSNKTETFEGSDPTDGAQLFSFLTESFLIEWEKITQNNIDEMKYVLSRYGIDQKLEKRGFRPITARQAWLGYQRESEREILAVKKEIEKVEEKIPKWIPHNGFNFPTFRFDLPWKKSGKLL